MGEVIVIGGGVVGSAAAYHLIRNGQAVTLVDRTDDGGLAAELADSLFAGRTLSFDAKQEAAIASLTVAQVNEALRKYVKPERLVLAIAGDFK